MCAANDELWNEVSEREQQQLYTLRIFGTRLYSVDFQFLVMWKSIFLRMRPYRIIYLKLRRTTHIYRTIHHKTTTHIRLFCTLKIQWDFRVFYGILSILYICVCVRWSYWTRNKKMMREESKQWQNNGLCAHPEWKGKIYNFRSFSLSLWHFGIVVYTSSAHK